MLPFFVFTPDPKKETNLGKGVSMIDMNRPLELADELIYQLSEETDNAADLLGGIALAIRWMQGYQEYVLLACNPMLRSYKTKEEE